MTNLCLSNWIHLAKSSHAEKSKENCIWTFFTAGKTTPLDIYPWMHLHLWIAKFPEQLVCNAECWVLTNWPVTQFTCWQAPDSPANWAQRGSRRSKKRQRKFSNALFPPVEQSQEGGRTRLKNSQNGHFIGVGQWGYLWIHLFQLCHLINEKMCTVSLCDFFTPATGVRIWKPSHLNTC